jgi:hypothetical protein
MICEARAQIIAALQFDQKDLSKLFLVTTEFA